MASHQLLHFCVLTSLLFIFISPCHSSSDNTVAKVPSPVKSQLVNLSLYYESLCPYCANFIVNQLVNVFQTDLINIVNLRLVPWGNALLEPSKTIICQHGPAECYLNTIHACAINYWQDVKKHFDFIRCVESQTLKTQQIGDAKAAWVKCSQNAGFGQKHIEDCYDSGYGNKLTLQYANETNYLNPPHKYVPWVTVNKIPLYDDYANFVAYVCKAYKGKSPPKACKVLPSSSEKKNSIHPVSYAGEATKSDLFSAMEMPMLDEPEPPA